MYVSELKKAHDNIVVDASQLHFTHGRRGSHAIPLHPTPPISSSFLHNFIIITVIECIHPPCYPISLSSPLLFRLPLKKL